MPRVSVIIPNYNHARFLDLRIRSVLEQSFKDFELIVLDDASTDNSRDIIQGYAGDPRMRTCYSEHNSGSVFRQWNRGVREARGEYVWLAESDDYSELTFLERLVEVLDRNPNVGLAYSASMMHYESYDMLWYLHYPEVERSHWQADYVASGASEVADHLLFRCFIPNASSVVFRRDVFVRAGYADESFRMSGDYMMWAKMMRLADVGYVAEPLNYWRFHDSSVSFRGKRNGLYAEECYLVACFMGRHFAMDRETFERRCEELMDDWLIQHRGPEFDISWSQHLRILLWALRTDPSAQRRLREKLAQRWPNRRGMCSLLVFLCAPLSVALAPRGLAAGKAP